MQLDGEITGNAFELSTLQSHMSSSKAKMGSCSDWYILAFPGGMNNLCPWPNGTPADEVNIESKWIAVPKCQHHTDHEKLKPVHARMHL